MQNQEELRYKRMSHQRSMKIRLETKKKSVKKLLMIKIIMLKRFSKLIFIKTEQACHHVALMGGGGEPHKC